MRANNRSSHRHKKEKLERQSKERLLIVRNVWFLIVLAKLLSLLTLILTYYH